MLNPEQGPLSTRCGLCAKPEAAVRIAATENLRVSCVIGHEQQPIPVAETNGAAHQRNPVLYSHLRFRIAFKTFQLWSVGPGRYPAALRIPAK
jgi:hypothetical protein